MVTDDFSIHDIDQGQLEKELLCSGDVTILYVHFPELVGSIYLHSLGYTFGTALLNSALRQENP
jgi:hypothetical protein